MEIIIFIVIAAFIGMLIAGATNKIVIYYDVSDLFISIAPWVILLIPNFLGLVEPHSFFWYVLNCISVIFALWSIKLSIDYNRNLVLGLFVGIFKLSAALLGVLVVFDKLLTLEDKDSSASDTIKAMLVLAIVGWISKILINGEQVYLEKGWELPEKVEES